MVISHGAAAYVSGTAEFDSHIFRFGQFGVVLFFLCSGFIIPASLERHGSLQGFWISRFFRLYPIYWVATLAALALVLIFNPAYAPWYNALLFALMFTGTVFYRWVHGEISGRTALIAGVAAAAVAESPTGSSSDR